MHQTLERAFPIVAAAIGNRFGISVAVGGTDAYTDGQSIHLPGYNGSDPQYQNYAWGYLAHEAAHIRYSDFQLDFGGSVLRRRICGAIEDVRIEHELAKVYPGTRLTLARMVEQMLTEGRLTAQTASDHPGNVLFGYILKRLRAKVLDQTVLEPLVDATREALRACFPRGALIRLEGLLSEVPEGLNCERDCLDLTDRILAMLEEECTEPAATASDDQSDTDPEDDNTRQSDTDSAKDDQPSSDSDAEDEQNGTNPEDSAPSDQDSDPGNGSATSPNPPSGTGEPANQDSAKQASLMDQLNTLSEQDLEQDWFETAKSQLGLAPDSAEKCTLPVGLFPKGSRLVGQALANRVEQNSKALRVALQSAVQSHRQNRPQAVRNGRRIDPRRLTKLALGDARVFCRSGQRVAPNCAVHILLDKSESMDHILVIQGEEVSLLTLALEASMALALALESIQGVNPAITAFPGADDKSVHQVLRHGEKVRDNLGRFSVFAANTTPMTQAIWFAAAQLLQCREPRKLLLTVTDGVPNDLPGTLSILKRCRDSGIETIGIGLGVEVGHLFPVAVTINDLAELRPQLFELSKAMLLAA
ncbi:nitric oxide reductase activation protein [Methylomonas koyamae]|uniref:Nitric oxide reductase activation protein n=1 Tax=Methylomonas koyamae TaxID=702114 RepID=A0A177N5T0_9GAMM|nr:VWA domain-containing protein [Methylomonas koyamae]OAI13191.1 nitric oxide reductase activation protein [Methylomonas koyamae]